VAETARPVPGPSPCRGCTWLAESALSAPGLEAASRGWGRARTGVAVPAQAARPHRRGATPVQLAVCPGSRAPAPPHLGLRPRLPYRDWG
jgi:hypothetical protein